MAGSAAPFPAPTTILYLSLLLAAGHLISSPTPVSGGAEEGEALLRFKSTLYGLDADLPTWIPGPAPCIINSTTWEGVICFNGHVWGIQLENRGLVGTLDVEPLIALIGLRAISFMNNDLAGPLPDLNRLGALKAVYLSGNNFSGEIQSGAFVGMRSLKKLFISDNGFTGPIPESLVNLSKLLEVRLDHNKFAGEIPEFGQPGLIRVDVSFNALEGPIPPRLSKMDPTLFQGNPKLCGAPLKVPCVEKRQPKRHGFFGFLLALIIVSCTLFSLALFFLLYLFLRRRHNQTVVMGRPSSKRTKTAFAAANNLGAGSPEKHHHHGSHGRLVFLQDATDRFELPDLLRAPAEVLGSGNFGSSFKAALSGGPTVVVKRFRQMNGVGREDFDEHMRRLGRLAHPNLLPVVAYYYRKEEKLIITHFVANGSLAHMLHGNRGSAASPPLLDFPARLRIVKGVARGLGYLYDELPVLKLPHGHLKSSNVLLDGNLEPLLADYGLAPVMNAGHAAEVMVAYKSPEVAQFGRPSKKSDVWSLGMLILEMLTGRFPANFLRKGSGGGSGGGGDLAAWVRSVMEEGSGEGVFDGDMRDGAAAGDGDETMRELLGIGMDCCRENADERMGMREALERIEQLNPTKSINS